MRPPLPGREIDLVLLYHDARDERLQLKTSEGKPIHSFVLVIEVKQHSTDLIRFEGPRVLVRYDQLWSDATYQCDDQTWALKRYQKAPYKGKKSPPANICPASNLAPARAQVGL